jgi:hypothetical protein
VTNISLSLNTASDVGPVHQLSGKVRKPQSPGFNTGSCPEVWGKTCLGLISFVEKADFHLLSQDTIIIYTDFAATMVLGASEKKNSSLDGHAVLANFVVISNRRLVPVEEIIIEAGVKLTSEDEVRVFDVDVHHFLGGPRLQWVALERARGDSLQYPQTKGGLWDGGLPDKLVRLRGRTDV